MGEWAEPDAGARYVCDDGVVRTWSQMTASLEPEDYPASEAMCRDLLWAFGAVPARAVAPLCAHSPSTDSGSQDGAVSEQEESTCSWARPRS